MRHFLFICGLMFFLGACESSDQFASVGDDIVEENQLASEAPVYQTDLQSIVEEEVEETKRKVGGKKRAEINVVETVGGKNFDDGRTVIVTNVEVRNVVEDGSGEAVSSTAMETEISTGITVSETVSAAPAPGKKLDILFHLKTRAANCVRKFNAMAKKNDFMSNLEEVNWNIGFSVYAESGSASLFPLESRNGKPFNSAEGADNFFNFDFEEDFEADYVLSKGEYPYERARELFNFTLMDFDPSKSPSRRAGESPLNEKDYNSNGYVADPLAGLDQLLSQGAQGLIRPGSHTAILLFDYDFPYYSPKRWRSFFTKHRNASLVVLAHRSANVSNLLHALQGYNVKFFDACGSEDSYSKLMGFLKSRAR